MIPEPLASVKLYKEKAILHMHTVNHGFCEPVSLKCRNYFSAWWWMCDYLFTTSHFVSLLYASTHKFELCFMCTLEEPQLLTHVKLNSSVKYYFKHGYYELNRMLHIFYTSWQKYLFHENYIYFVNVLDPIT